MADPNALFTNPSTLETIKALLVSFSQKVEMLHSQSLNQKVSAPGKRYLGNGAFWTAQTFCPYYWFFLENKAQKR